MDYEYEHPLVPAAVRFPIGSVPADPVRTDPLSPPSTRAFLLRFTEPLTFSKHTKKGATAPATTGSGDGVRPGNEDYTPSDYEP